jgi:O-methyltransferase
MKRMFNRIKIVLVNLFVWLIRNKNMSLIIYSNTSEQKENIATLLKIKGRQDILRAVFLSHNTLQLKHEAFNILMLTKASTKLSGDLAEVGVFKGGSAQIICEAKGKRILYLFDGFDEGFPGTEDVHIKGSMPVKMEEVKNRLKQYPNVYFYRGAFQDNCQVIAEKKFSFVHLDVDTYYSTRDCLNFFVPRMSKGGIILIHDYSNSRCPGVKKATDEFFDTIPLPVIELAGTQCVVMV